MSAGGNQVAVQFKANILWDRHPELENVWVMGAGNAIGEYTAQRVLEQGDQPELDEVFQLKLDE